MQLFSKRYGRMVDVDPAVVEFVTHHLSYSLNTDYEVIKTRLLNRIRDIMRLIWTRNYEDHDRARPNYMHVELTALVNGRLTPFIISAYHITDIISLTNDVTLVDVHDLPDKLVVSGSMMDVITKIERVIDRRCEYDETSRF